MSTFTLSATQECCDSADASVVCRSRECTKSSMRELSVEAAHDSYSENELERLKKTSVGENGSSQLKFADAYFSADVETDGPIPGPFSMLSFAIVYAGSYDGFSFRRPERFEHVFYCEVKPISDHFQKEALDINKLNRDELIINGEDPTVAMDKAHRWVTKIAGNRQPVLAAYPVSFDWTWLYWYFIAFCEHGSPFNHSRCFDIKTAMAVKTGTTISQSGRSKLPKELRSARIHTHHAIDDAIEQAEIFANVFEWKGG